MIRPHNASDNSSQPKISDNGRASDDTKRRGALSTAQSHTKSESKKTGDFYRVVVRPKKEFKLFRTQDVGKKAGLERVAGKSKTGVWSTQAWLVSKKEAHKEGRRLIADSRAARELFRRLGRVPMQVNGDVFTA